MKELTFTGFQSEGLDLLIQNRLMDSKDFYEAHKQEIRQQMSLPFQALCQRMTPDMQQIDPLFVTTPSRMVSRIRRDTRYTKDKTLYRANIWLYFRRPKMNQYDCPPFYYMEVAPEYWGYGCFGGYGKGEMEIARDMIRKKDKLFLDLMYIETFSIWLDIKLIFQTLTVFLKGDSSEGFKKEEPAELVKHSQEEYEGKRDPSIKNGKYMNRYL